MQCKETHALEQRDVLFLLFDELKEKIQLSFDSRMSQNFFQLQNSSLVKILFFFPKHLSSTKQKIETSTNSYSIMLFWDECMGLDFLSTNCITYIDPSLDMPNLCHPHLQIDTLINGKILCKKCHQQLSFWINFMDQLKSTRNIKLLIKTQNPLDTPPMAAIIEEYGELDAYFVTNMHCN